MKSRAPERARLTLLYDPLCGWCYGATPFIRRLSQEPGLSIELVPTGLFSGEGARPVDERFARYAWSNDERIAQLTGQPFSQRYRDLVLADRGMPLDSGPAIVALTAAMDVAPEHELPALESIQAARYVQGRNVTDHRVLAEILSEIGLDTAASRVETRTPKLVDASAARMVVGRDLLRAAGAHGVPTLVAHEHGALRVIPSHLLYGRIHDVGHRVGAASSLARTESMKENAS